MRRLLSPLPTWVQPLKRFALALVATFAIFQLFTVPAQATSVYELPPFDPSTWVLDRADVISRINEGKLSTTFADLADKTGYEVRVVSIHRLDYGETAQTFADKLFDYWYATPEAQANQVLLVIDNVTNNTGIHTGSQVKTVMPDPIATSVAQESVLIPLQEGNKYNQAFLGAGDRLVAVLSGQADPGPPEFVQDVMVEGTFASKEDTKESNATIWVVGFLIAATVIPMATYYFYQWMGSR